LGVFPLAFAFLNEDDFKHFYDTIQLFEVSVNVFRFEFYQKMSVITAGLIL
jgi:hypothetical protein